MAASYTYTCYLIDVSPSMQEPMFPTGQGEYDDGDDTLNSDSGQRSRTRLEYALDFVKTKVAQRLINPKKTDQIAVVLFGGKSHNSLDSRGLDGYSNIHEFVQMKQPTFEDLARLDTIQGGHTDVDLIAAMYVAGEVVREAQTRRKDSTKVVVMLTDAEEPPSKDDDGDPAVVTAWDDKSWLDPLFNAVVPGRNGIEIDWKKLFKLGIIGTDFGDPNFYEQDESTWSPQKRINVARLQKLAVDINDQCPPGSERVLIGDLMSAIEGASAPSVAPIRTVTKVLKLTIGDMDEFPGQSIAFDVELQKATQKASGKSMGRMRKDAWNKTLEQARTQVAGQKRRRGQDSDDEAEEDDEVGYTQEPGNLVTQKLWYYTPSHDKEAGKKQPSKPGEEDADEDEDEEAESGQNSEAKRKLETDQNVSRAYKYGADLLPISKEEEEEFLQFPAGEPGLQVRGFVKASEYHPEWALNDPYWVFGGTENRSQLLFSGLLHALQDSKMLALVRMLQPKSVQPRVALLMPLLGDASPSPGLECGLLIQMPFKEEIANWSFPSLDRIHTTSGREVTEHRLLPKKNLLEAMDSFVDSMMLPVYANEADEMQAEPSVAGESSTSVTPWFVPESSYNPAIHNTRNCLIYKLLHPGATIDAKHQVSPHLARFLFPPDEVISASADAALSLGKAANLTLIPPKPKMSRGQGGRRKQAAKPTSDALLDILGADPDRDEEAIASQKELDPLGYQQSQSQGLYKTRSSQPQSSSTAAAASASAPAPDSKAGTSSANGNGHKSRTASKGGNGKRRQSAATDTSATEGSETEDDEVSDAAVAEEGEGDTSSLISWKSPIEDYDRLVQQPGMITTANKHMLAIIPRFVEAAKNEKELQRAQECVRRAREVAIEEDEADFFNTFMYDLKKGLELPQAKNPNFLKRLQHAKLGLISTNDVEDDTAAGIVSAKEAEEFWSSS